MSALLQFAFEFHQIQCYKCKQPFAVSAGKYKRCRENGEDFYCPDGHCQIFSESEKQRLEKQLAQEQNRRVWAEKNAEYARKQQAHQGRRANAFKGAITRIKNRVGNGVCPCCNRSFSNIKRHIDLKHPTFNKEQA